MTNEPVEPPGKRARKRARDVRAIVDATRALAEQGGFDGVRLREVAARAGVSMGALYRCFQTKEEILLFAFAEDFNSLEQRIATRPPEGTTSLDRMEAFFRLATRGVVSRPRYGQAVIAAVSMGQLAAVRQVATLHARMGHLITSCITPESARDLDPHALTVASEALNRVWFAALIAWAGGLRTEDDVVREVRSTADLLLAGAEVRSPAATADHSAAAAVPRSS